MSKILTEENKFLMTNLKTLLKTSSASASDTVATATGTVTNNNTNDNTNNNFNKTNSQQTADNQTKTAKQLNKNLNWKQELIDRIEANKQVTPDLKKPEVEVIEEFWNDCFNTLWPQVQEELKGLGNYFKNDLIKWGFTNTTNPLVAFISQSWVQKNLLKTKKLNVGSYSALHNAVLNKLVAQLEFHKNNKYNIIYCLDLYNKTPAEIYKYLETQRNILNSNVNTYKEADCLKNRRAFLSLGLNSLSPDKAAVQHIKRAESKIPTVQKATLNSLDLVNEVLQLYDNKKEPEPVATAASEDTTNNLFNSIKTLSDASALLTYLYSSTGNDKIAKFIEAHQDKLAISGNIPIKLLQKFKKDLGKDYLSDKALNTLFNTITSSFLEK